MGVDIHMVVDELQDWNPEGPTPIWRTVIDHNAAWSHRNSFLFGLLAGVRQAFPPITPPRGLPPTQCNGHSLGEHHQTWYLLSELLAVDWKTKITLRGMLDPLNFARVHFNRLDHLSYGMEPDVAGGLSNDAMLAYLGNHPVSEEEMQDPGFRREDPRWARSWTTWESTYERESWGFATWLRHLHRMTWMGTQPDRVRLVMGFDG